MKNNQSSEDYLETILLLSREGGDVHQIDVARRMNVSQPAVLKAVKLLVNNGYVQLDGLHLVLTEQGRAYALSVYERHRVITEFLVVHGVSREVAVSDACEMEHTLSEETFQMMKDYIASVTNQ